MVDYVKQGANQYSDNNKNYLDAQPQLEVPCFKSKMGFTACVK